MVELHAPANSKVGKGKPFRRRRGRKKVKTFKIYRWIPDDGENPRWDTYDVDSTPAARWCWTR
jgi:succinate dehydrogenase / fumarate reductase iron-sulfur subunit